MGPAPMPSRLPWRGLFALWAVAAALSVIGLGDVPLRDFDEATVARVALELHKGTGEAALLPTLWGNPYLNKAPGLHLIIAAVIGMTPASELPDEWTIRIAPALLSSLVVPLGGMLLWRLRPGDRTSALATSVILMTLLPVASLPWRATGRSVIRIALVARALARSPGRSLHRSMPPRGTTRLERRAGAIRIVHSSGSSEAGFIPITAAMIRCSPGALLR